MSRLTPILDLIDAQRRPIRLSLLAAALIVLGATLLGQGGLLPSLGAFNSTLPDAISVAALMALFAFGTRSHYALPINIWLGRLVALICLFNLCALMVLQGSYLDPSKLRLAAYLMDPEIALTVGMAALFSASQKQTEAFRNLSRHIMVLLVPAFGLLSTTIGLHDSAHTGNWQPTNGMSIPLAILLSVSALSELARFSLTRNQRVLAISLPLPGMAYFILSDLYSHLGEKQIGLILIDVAIIGSLIVGARVIADAVDVFFNMMDRLERRNSTLIRQNTVIQDLVYALAHDLRSPARGIVQTAEWMREDIRHQDLAQLEQRAGIISERAEALYERLDAFVEYVRLGSFVARRQDVALNLLAENLVGAMPNAAQRIITLHGEELIVTTDESALASILSNLLENAVRYADSAAPKVELTWEKRGTDLMIRVTDNGPGLRKSAHTKLFQPFRGARAEDGINGMGLAYAARLTEALGGKIAVISEPGRKVGTEFRCELPLSKLGLT
ncbi:sensor histidine kinase [Donghicola mangrovi]|uniref:histidine kinase n=1 Tax=Donghicola mangrovi TaxID=2729614 RepID=A0A850Q7T7_9RHOB|nr:HAMP domain-containing sensor histidine kinase [Donghicola mangrovi]NVO24974.1 HAMP domain-containing histidine kinase [Donghicola mangrovi]